MKNQVQLITYVDRFSAGGIPALRDLLNSQFQGLFAGVHLLPFFDPIDGADAGFDPVDHTRVDPRLGDWQDIRALSKEVDVMADVIVNHISANSAEFKDYRAKGTASPYAYLFLSLERVFPEGAREADLLAIYRPRPGLPFSAVKFDDGTKRLLWTTFTDQQLDIDVESTAGKAYLARILDRFAESGIRMIRLDAAGYAIKKPGTTCFMIPESIAFVQQFTEQCHGRGMEVLVEIHAYYQDQIEIARHVDRVYDFALPPLILHTLFTRTTMALKQWLAISPRNAVTVLDTHDGIGVIDIGAGGPERPGLVGPEALDQLVETIHQQSRGESQQATGGAASNLDLYQVNCTYYDALGRNDRAYLIARALQFFCPGVPQVYYVGLLAGENDMTLLDKTRVGRDINRHYYTLSEREVHGQRPVVQDLMQLIRWRNEQHEQFAGTFAVKKTAADQICLHWQHGEGFAELQVDLAQMDARITHGTASASRTFSLFRHLDAVGR